MSAERVTLTAPAKINLTLDVLRKRPDGYHELESIMQSVSLCDKVTVSARRAMLTSVSIKTDKPYIPRDSRNTAYKAALKLLERTGITAEVRIDIKKRIPVGAGLGGGSTDAAAVMTALVSLLDMKLTTDELLAIGAEVGADVPFSLLCGTALACGIGERLTPLSALKGIDLVIVKPKVSMSTAQLFGILKAESIDRHPDTKRMLDAVSRCDRRAIAAGLMNVLQPLAVSLRPQIGELIRSMKSMNAEGVSMTGSGTAVFGIFPSRDKAKAAQKQLSKEYEEAYAVVTA